MQKYTKQYLYSELKTIIDNRKVWEYERLQNAIAGLFYVYLNVDEISEVEIFQFKHKLDFVIADIDKIHLGF